MTEKTVRTSVLGDASQLYQVKSNAQGAILDQPERGLLELYPAGYTKPSNRDNVSRQEVFKSIYELAVSKGIEENSYPFEQNTHNITLLPDPANPFDKNAIHLILNAPKGSPLNFLNGKDLGFIPKKINTNILRNIELINGGRILRVKCNFHKKYYGAKIIFAYGPNTFEPASTLSLSRFSAILED